LKNNTVLNAPIACVVRFVKMDFLGKQMHPNLFGIYIG